MVPGAQGRLASLLVIIRFSGGGDVAGVVSRLVEAVAILHDQGGLLRARIGRAVDDADLVVLTLEWESVGAYRRALSNFDVKVSVVPVLSTAMDEPTAFEIVHGREGEVSFDASGALAADAGSVRLGEAAAGHVPPAP